MEISHFRHDEIDRQVWNDFIRSSPMGAMYGLGEYLDIISPNWGALVINKGEKWLAVMPWFQDTKWGMKRMYQPLLCQFQGIYWSDFPKEAYKQYEWKRKVVTMMVEKADSLCSRFHSNFAPSFDYPLPFYWDGYNLAPRFSYGIDLKAPLPELSERHRRSIKKITDSNVQWNIKGHKSEFLNALRASFNTKGVQLKDQHYQSVERIIDTFLKTEEAILLECRDKGGNWLCGMLLYAFGNTFTYYLGASSEQGRKENAMTFLMNEAILLAKARDASYFDFEGSMIKNVETFFRGFGATPRLFFEISKKPGILK